MLCPVERRPWPQPLSISVFRIPTGIESQPIVLARHDNEPGVSKASRSYSSALSSEPSEDDIWFLVSPAPDQTAGTRANRGIQGSTGKKLRPHGLQGQVGQSNTEDLRQGRPRTAHRGRRPQRQ